MRGDLASGGRRGFAWTRGNRSHRTGSPSRPDARRRQRSRLTRRRGVVYLETVRGARGPPSRRLRSCAGKSNTVRSETTSPRPTVCRRRSRKSTRTPRSCSRPARGASSRSASTERTSSRRNPWGVSPSPARCSRRHRLGSPARAGAPGRGARGAGRARRALTFRARRGRMEPCSVRPQVSSRFFRSP